MLNLKHDNKDANSQVIYKYSINIFKFTEQDLRLYIKNFSSCPEIEKVLIKLCTIVMFIIKYYLQPVAGHTQNIL